MWEEWGQRQLEALLPTHSAHPHSPVPRARACLRRLKMLASSQEKPRSVPRKALWGGALSAHHPTWAEIEDRKRRSPGT